MIERSRDSAGRERVPAHPAVEDMESTAIGRGEGGLIPLGLPAKEIFPWTSTLPMNKLQVHEEFHVV